MAAAPAGGRLWRWLSTFLIAAPHQDDVANPLPQLRHILPQGAVGGEPRSESAKDALAERTAPVWSSTRNGV